MAKKEPAKLATPDNAARAAEAAKTSRLRALRLTKEAEDAASAKDAADREAAAKLRKSSTRRRIRATDQPVSAGADLIGRMAIGPARSRA